jgi:hypothetical protein
MNEQRPKISFGIIVLNGEPFTRYCLRALYPFAHEIIVVEGACRSAACIATPLGHSQDGTLETLHRFKTEEDPDDKIHVISKDIFWGEKQVMCRAFAEKATGDYLWQVDIDEFYRPEDMERIILMLQKHPDITSVSFEQIAFWGGFNYITDGYYLKCGGNIFHRVFKWGPGFSYLGHRPPTVLDDKRRNMRLVNPLTAQENAKHGIYLYHYSLLFPKHVLDKSKYYDAAPWAWCTGMTQWAEQNYLELRDPFHVHNVYLHTSWLKRFKGQHPYQIQQLQADIKSGVTPAQMRASEDIEKLLHSIKYNLRVGIAEFLMPLYAFWLWLSGKSMPSNLRIHKEQLPKNSVE